MIIEFLTGFGFIFLVLVITTSVVVIAWYSGANAGTCLHRIIGRLRAVPTSDRSSRLTYSLSGSSVQHASISAHESRKTAQTSRTPHGAEGRFSRPCGASAQDSVDLFDLGGI